MGDVQTGLTDQMSHQRHVGTVFVFLVGGVQFNLLDLCSFPKCSAASFICMLG